MTEAHKSDKIPILTLGASLFNNREAVVVDSGSATNVPLTFWAYVAKRQVEYAH